MRITDLLQGAVVETKTQSLTGPLLYSDKMYHILGQPHRPAIYLFNGQTPLNLLAQATLVGIAAGIIRMALAIIHIAAHLFMAFATLDKGHCYHAAKGGCEFLKGSIEATPFAGRIFARWYAENGYWWMIKIYNPDLPDGLDHYAECWASLRQNRPAAYVIG